MTKIVKEGYFFRAVNEDTGYASQAVTSASQAGMIIKRKFGRKAFEAALLEYTSRKS